MTSDVNLSVLSTDCFMKIKFLLKHQNTQLTNKELYGYRTQQRNISTKQIGNILTKQICN